MRLSVRQVCGERMPGMYHFCRPCLHSARPSPLLAVWLERGMAEAGLDDRPAARKSFLEAISLDREGLIGKSAQRALQRMDAGISD